MTNINSVSLNRKKNVEKRFWLSVAFSVVAIFLCLAALCASTYALFHKEAKSEGNVVRTAVYVLNFQLDSGEVKPAHYGALDTEGTYVLYTLTPGTDNTHHIYITYDANVPGNASAGFVVITVNDGCHNTNYYTAQVNAEHPNCDITVNVGSTGGTVKVAPCWGTHEGTTVTSVNVGHIWGEWTETTAPTCTEAGEETRVCANDASHTETRPVEALGHDLVHHEAQAATCTAIGWDAYDTCSRCDYTTYVEIPALGHNMTAHAAVAATCETAGNSAYWSCDRCGKYFSDAEGTTEIAANSWVINATGHAYGAPVWAWTGTSSATATFTCANDENHTEIVNATITSESGTGENAGYTVYTATVSFNNAPYTSITRTLITYSITYNLDGGAASGNPMTYTVESAAITLNNPTREGYTFAGWTGTDLSGATETVTIAQGSTGDREYTATWTQNSGQVTITFKANYQDGPADYTQNVDSNTATLLTANTFERSGYNFTGWNTAADGTGTAYTDEQEVTITEPLILYAQWKQKITFTHSDNLAHVDTYLYRVGNGNTVTLGTLFKVDGDGTPDPANVKIKVEAVENNSSVKGDGTNLESGSTAKCVYTKNDSDWTKSTLKFTGEGPVKVTISEGNGETYTLNLEVVNGNNFVENATLTGNANIVLLGNVKVPGSSGTNSALTLSGKNLWGNGFQIDCTGSNISSKAFGIISLTNSRIDNAIINGPTYPEYPGSYGSDYYAATVICYDNAEITNSHISGAADPVCVYGTNVKVSDTILTGGVFANMHIRNRGGVTVSNVTTINTQNSLGIVFYNSTSDSYIIINGELTQHNFISQNATMSNTNATTLKNKVFNSTYSRYHFTSGGTKYANMGIVSMDDGIGATQIIDNRLDKKNYSGMVATMSVLNISVNGYVYTMENTDPSMLETSYTEPTYVPSTQLPYPPVFTWSVPSGDNVAAGGDAHCYKDNSGTLQIQFVQGDIKTINPTNYQTFKKYGGSAIAPSSITCTKNSSGVSVPVSNGNITFTEAGEYTITYQYNGVTVYDKDLGTTTTVNYSKTIPVNVRVKQNRPNATITSSSDTGTIGWGGAGSGWDPDYNPCIPFLDGLTITDYDANGNAYTVLDGSNQSSFISSISSVSVSGTTVTINLANGTKLVVKGPAVDGSVQIKAYSNKMYYCDSTADNNPGAFTKTFAKNSYTYTGENGVAVSYGTARSFTSTTSTSTIATYSSMGTPWTSNKFLIYDAQGGTVSPTYASSSPATLPTPTREGYAFLNWNTKADGTGTARNAGTSMTFSSTTTLYAIWAANVTVSFDGCGGADPASISAGAGTSQTLPTSTLMGAWLEGWYTEATGGTKIGNAGASFTVPASDTTYYAHWNPTYTVIYNANGGTVSQDSDVYAGTALTLPAPTNGSKTFEGWFTAAEGGAKVGAAGDSYIPTANIELFAQWSDNILVTFDGNGGTAGTNSATYDHVTPITLPSATWAKHAFNGWYTAASGGTRVGGAGDSYEPTEAVTLYAQWTSYTVSFDGNGATDPSSEISEPGGTITLPSISRTGYTFNGWYTAASGGTRVGGAGESYTVNGNVTLHAQWTILTYTVTIKAGSNGSVSPTSVTNVPYNSTITVNSNKLTINGTTVTATANSNYAFDKWDVSNGAKVTGNMTITASFKSSSSGCLIPGTMITLADGTQKAVEEILPGDMLLVWNLDTGSYGYAPVVFNDSDPAAEYTVMHACFSDGTDIGIVSEHGFFDLDLGKYVYISEDTLTEYVGHTFVKLGDTASGTWETAVLTDVWTETVCTAVYSPVTAVDLCYYTEGILSMPGGINGLFNIFEVDVGTMTYDAEAMQNDIETYGLLTLEDFGGMITEDMFNAFNGQYLGIAVGKGQLTWEYIAYLAERYGPLCD